MTNEIIQVSITRVRPNPYQPRSRFSEDSLAELAETIRQHGVLQPILVRSRGAHYLLIAGERRLRAAERAGLTTIPAIVRELDERQMLELALVENLQREDINPAEAARAFQRLAEEFGLTQSEIAQRTGKSRAAVANTLRLLQLPSDVLREIEEGRLSEGHGRALLQLSTNAERRELCSHVLAGGLTVRETEQAVLDYTHYSKGVSRETPLTAGLDDGETPSGAAGAREDQGARDPLQGDLEERLRRRFGTKVELRQKGGKGSLTFHFYSDEDLERIVELLGIEG